MKHHELLRLAPLWAIHPSALAAILSLEAKPFQAAKPSTMGRGANKVAVVPIQGVLASGSQYGTSYEAIQNAVEAAANDPAVKHIVLSVDSPGGNVTGLPETAATIAAAARIKPVTAMVEGMAASAAYWLASQASKVVITPSGEVGSVGVRMMHVDVTKAMDEAGYKVTEMHAGDFKTEWSPFSPLSDGAKAAMQTRLDASHQDFLAAVKTGRGSRATQDITDKRFGEGRMFDGQEAAAHGLVDAVQSSRDFYRSVTPAAEAEPITAPTFPIGPARARLEVERARF